MNVSHYFEFEKYVSGGIRESVRNQRKMLRHLGIDGTTDPHLDSDVLHLNLMGPRSVWYAKRARARGVPVIAHTHVTAEDFCNSFRFTNRLATPLKPYLEWTYGLADVLVCPSAHNRRLIREYTDTTATVISNGVDRERLDGFEAFESAYRDRYGLHPPVVFAVGHVLKRKGLEAFVETARRMPDLDFAWFGPLHLSLKGRSTRKLIENSPENCTFTGFVDDIRGAYAAGDVFFFPSREESEGIALLEAMSTGKPVLVRDIEPFSWLEDGYDCLKSTDSFEEELEALEDPALRERLGANAARTSEAFSLPETARQLRRLYEEVID